MLLLDDVFLDTKHRKDKDFVVYNKKTTEVIYVGEDKAKAESLADSNKKFRLLKPLIRHTITSSQIEEYSWIDTILSNNLG